MLRIIADGREVPIADGVARLEEARTYLVRLPAEASGADVLFDGANLRSSDQGFVLAIDHWIAGAHLEVVRDGNPVAPPLRVEVLPREEKLSPASWLAMLEDLESWVPAVTVGSAGGEHGSVKRNAASAPLVAAALGPVVSPLVRSLRTLTSAPRRRTHEILEEVPVRNLRRVERESVAWSCRHPEVLTASDLWTAADTKARAPQFESFETVDHAANRYVAWLIRRVIAAVGAIRLDLEARVRNAEPDARSWFERRIALLEGGRRDLDGAFRTSFLVRLRPEPPSERALLAVRNDPVYARVHRLARIFLSPGFQLTHSEDGTAASIRPSYGVYELWAFLAVARMLRGVTPGLEWRSVRLHRLLDGVGTGAAFIARGPPGEMQVRFNLPFVGYLHREGRERWSISRARRPDIVFTWRPEGGEPRWMCIDAKYRVSAANLQKAFASAHIYRDSLRWPDMGGRCTGALLVVPARKAECGPWFHDQFYEKHRVGACVLRPGVTGSHFADRVLAAFEMPGSGLGPFSV